MLILFWPKALWPRGLGFRFVVAVITVWILLIFENHVTLPARLAAAEARGNDTYDGTGAASGTLILGWLLGIIGSLPALILCLIRNRWRQRRNAKEYAPPPADA